MRHCLNKTAYILQQYDTIKQTNIITYVYYYWLLITHPLYSTRITLRFSGVLYWVSRYLPRVKICLRSGSKQTLWQERALGPPWWKLKYVLVSEIWNRHKASLNSSNAHLTAANQIQCIVVQCGDMKPNVTVSFQTRIGKVTGGHLNPWSFHKQLNMMMEVGLLSTFKIIEHNGEESFSTAKSPSVHQEVSHLSWRKKIQHCDHESDTKSPSRAKSSKCLDFYITLTKPSITVTPSTKISHYSLVIFHQKLYFGNILM